MFSYQYAFTGVKCPCCLHHRAKIPVGAYQLNCDKMLKNKKNTSYQHGSLFANCRLCYQFDSLELSTCQHNINYKLCKTLSLVNSVKWSYCNTIYCTISWKKFTPERYTCVHLICKIQPPYFETLRSSKLPIELHGRITDVHISIGNTSMRISLLYQIEQGRNSTEVLALPCSNLLHGRRCDEWPWITWQWHAVQHSIYTVSRKQNLIVRS